MKNFRLCNNNLANWYEVKFHNAIDVARAIKSNGFTTFEIEWLTPVTKEYKTLIKFENGVKVFENENFKLPKVFKKF